MVGKVHHKAISRFRSLQAATRNSTCGFRRGTRHTFLHISGMSLELQIETAALEESSLHAISMPLVSPELKLVSQPRRFEVHIRIPVGTDVRGKDVKRGFPELRVRGRFDNSI